MLVLTPGETRAAEVVGEERRWVRLTRNDPKAVDRLRVLAPIVAQLRGDRTMRNQATTAAPVSRRYRPATPADLWRLAEQGERNGVRLLTEGLSGERFATSA